MATTVDTLSYAKRLQQAGVSREHAEAQAEALRDFVVPDLATKSDIVSLKADIEALRTATKAELEAAKTEILARVETMLWKHMAGTILGVLAVGGLLIRFLR